MRCLVVVLLLGCSGVRSRPTISTASGRQPCDPAQDRRAILAMAGGHTVKFEFTETVPLSDGYELRPPYRVGATELVVVAEDRPDRIALQHILAMGEGKGREALKHWRQDWSFEPEDVLEYRGGETWAKRRLTDDERRCAWAQQVYGIEDAPRYGSWGRWVHQSGVSSWTSQDTWRPLPRREQKRDDYDVIVGSNRHTITPGGWVHEQDNGKLVLRGKHQLLVREHGVIPYRRNSQEDFSGVAAYWKGAEAFWRDVREGWREVLATRDRVAFVASDKNSRTLNDDLEDLQERAAGAGQSTKQRQRRVVEIISRHLEAAPPAAGGVAAAR